MLDDLQKTRLHAAFNNIKNSPGWHQFRQFIQGEVSSDEPDLGGLHTFIMQMLSDGLLDDIKSIQGARRG